MRHAALLGFIMLAPALAQAAPAGNCAPTKLMIVLDHSSSMLGQVDASKTPKWKIANDAITQIANTYDKKIALGLNVFPQSSACAPGTTVVKAQLDHGTKIINNLPGAPPQDGNYTPMAQTIDAAVDDLCGCAVKDRQALVVITDGFQWCAPYDPNTRLLGVDAVKHAKMKGVQVYVVGFGSEVDAFALNQMANEAGTALAGCDPNGQTVDAKNKCYYQADSSGALIQALDSVALKVSAEVCDGLDNDCNGLVDDGLVRNCANGCGAGTETCQAGTWAGCSAPAVSAEVCDGKDNNCDGTTDEGCTCKPGETRPCGSTMGACAMSQGSQRCGADGQWGECAGGTMPMPETCNGIDDDCDGYVDNAAPSTLCPNDEICDSDGTCKDPFNNGNDGAGPGGCACDLGGHPTGSVPPAAALLFLLGLGALIAARRRS